jgi:methylisocitrate lyase
MPYLIGNNRSKTPAGLQFRELVARGGVLCLPGAHNGMAALQARSAGFEALYLSGAAMSASMGLPDLGIITVDEVAFSCAKSRGPRACLCSLMEIPATARR